MWLTTASMVLAVQLSGPGDTYRVPAPKPTSTFAFRSGEMRLPAASSLTRVVHPPRVNNRAGRKMAWALIAGFVGLHVGVHVGGAMSSDKGDSAGMRGALVGAAVGSAGGGILGWHLAR